MEIKKSGQVDGAVVYIVHCVEKKWKFKEEQWMHKASIEKAMINWAIQTYWCMIPLATLKIS